MFRIGSRTYTLRIAPGPITDGDREVMVAFIEADQEIIVSAICPPGDRTKHLFHGIGFAWLAEVGRPADSDEWCKLWATVGASAVEDLESCGGSRAVKQLVAGDTLRYQKYRVVTPTARPCPYCRATINGECITEAPSRIGDCTVTTGCPHCGKSMVWRERVLADGTLGGPIDHSVHEPFQGAKRSR